MEKLLFYRIIFFVGYDGHVKIARIPAASEDTQV